MLFFDRTFYNLCKRAFDIFLATLGLIVGFPLMALIVLAVLAETPGPVIFSQRRLGTGKNVFSMHKFRKFPHDMSAGTGVTMRGDARMTRVGRFLERTKLDELPQLWNILKGEMSFVGPRPESLQYEELFAGEFAQVLAYRPGIFGPNQIAFRNEADMYPANQNPETFYRTVLFPQKAQADLDYFAHSSCFSDIRQIIQGVWVSLSGALGWRRFFGLHRPVLLADFVAIIGAWVLINFVRYQELESRIQLVFEGMLLLPAIIIPLMILSGCYRTPMRFFSSLEAPGFVRRVTLFWLFAFFVFIAFRYRNSSIAVGLFSYALSLFSMLLVRFVSYFLSRQGVSSPQPGSNNILIYGCGHTGTALVHLLRRFKNAHLLGFVDDNTALNRHEISKLTVLGCERDLANIMAASSFNQLWLSFRPSKTHLERLTCWCLKHNVKLVCLHDMDGFSGLQ